MNWTGGSLQRHSKNARKSVMQRQKQHFAKVRTALQNGPEMPSAPFRPSFLVDQDLNLGGRLPLFGASSIRHTGHMKRPQRRYGEHDAVSIRASWHANKAASDPQIMRGTMGERTRQVSSPCDTDAQGMLEAHRSVSQHSTYRQCDISKGILKDASRPKRKASDADSEGHLLEANRRRLLERRDWAGLTLSRPVNMHFASRKEKGNLAKRRKVDGQPRMRPYYDDTIIPRHGQGLHGDHRGKGTYNEAEDVRIRIGTDALISQTPVQQSESAKPHSAKIGSSGSSDLILFDLEGDHTGPKGSMQLPSVSEDNDNSAITTVSCYSESLSSQGKSAYRHEIIHHDNNHASRTSMREIDSVCRDTGNARPARRGLTVGSGVAYTRSPTGETRSSFHIREHVRGEDTRPFRLILEQPSTMGTDAEGPRVAKQGGIARTASPEAIDASVQELNLVDSAQEHEFGRSSVGRTSASLSSIVDADARAFVPISDHNLTHTADPRGETPLSRPQSGSVRIMNESQPTQWSHIATAGKTTCISTPSPSLPSIKRARQESMPRELFHINTNIDRSILHRRSAVINDGEGLRRTFVFDTGNNAPAASYNDHLAPRPASTMQSDNHSCVAVASSVNPTFFTTLPKSTSSYGDTGRISDTFVQNALGNRALPTLPGSRSQFMISPMAHTDSSARGASNACPHMGRVLSADEHSRLGMQSLTQALLLNNLSYEEDADASNIFVSSQGIASGIVDDHEVERNYIGPQAEGRSEPEGMGGRSSLFCGVLED